jgi:5-methylcytosine-specific restriction endonuclease McrA
MNRKQAIIAGSVYYIGKPCRHGHNSKRYVTSFACVECVNIRQITDKYKAVNIAIRANKKETKRIYDRAYRLKHSDEQKSIKLAGVVKRRTSKMQRTPKWVDAEELWLIKEVYKLAAERTKLHGFSWHVDHIVPLQGKLVSGLHTIANLQVIPASQNVQKSNTWSTR